MDISKDMEEGIWYQVDGDMDVATYGGTLAKWNGDSGIEYLRIESVVDTVGEREAVEVGKPYWISEGWVDWSGNVSIEEAVLFVREEEELCFEPAGTITGKQLVYLLGGDTSAVQWWRDQGDGFIEEDEGFQEIMKGCE